MGVFVYLTSPYLLQCWFLGIWTTTGISYYIEPPTARFRARFTLGIPREIYIRVHR